MDASVIRKELIARVDTIKVLPTLNAVIDKVLTVLSNDNASFHDLFGVVKYDQAMSSKVIAIANSAYYSRGAQIVNLERAMIAIGLDEIRRIVMCLVFLKEMLSQWNLSNDDLLSLWNHALSVACAAKMLAERTMAEDREKAFTVSILHDIGKIPFYIYGDRYRRLQQEARDGGQDICSLEREQFGIDHAELGYFISTKWRFPDEFSAVIAGHHGRGEGKSALTGIVMAADKFVENPDDESGPESLILREGAGIIEAETKKISGLLGVTPADK